MRRRSIIVGVAAIVAAMLVAPWLPSYPLTLLTQAVEALITSEIREDWAAVANGLEQDFAEAITRWVGVLDVIAEGGAV